MPYSIVLLDNNTDSLHLTKCTLEKISQVKIHSFSDPVQALRHIYTTEMPDLIITELFLPEMNGIDFLTRAEKKYPFLRAIIFSDTPFMVPANCIYPVISKEAPSYRSLYHAVVLLLNSE